jgi:ATP/ADP translocase
VLGLLGVVVNNMSVRNIGIVGYAVVLPVVMLMTGRLFAATEPTTGR